MRKIALFTLLFFLWAQAGLALHTMEHGLGKHEHAGKKCEACLFVKEFGNSLTSDHSEISLPTKMAELQFYFVDSSADFNFNLFSSARGPPSIIS